MLTPVYERTTPQGVLKLLQSRDVNVQRVRRVEIIGSGNQRKAILHFDHHAAAREFLAQRMRWARASFELVPVRQPPPSAAHTDREASTASFQQLDGVIHDLAANLENVVFRAFERIMGTRRNGYGDRSDYDMQPLAHDRYYGDMRGYRDRSGGRFSRRGDHVPRQ